MRASPARHARRRGSTVLERAVVLVAAGAVLALSGCASFAPESRDAAVSTPEPAEHEHAVAEEPGREPAVAVLDPGDVEHAISRRKRVLAGQLDEPPSVDDAGYYMDVQEAQLRQALNGSSIGLFRENPGILLRMSGTEAFETGSVQLNPAVDRTLADVAEVLADYRLTLVVVHGHTDAAGDVATNQRLSEQRALAVARRLVDSGLDAERIATVGHGESRPLLHETSPDSRWPDRRIEIQLELISR